MNAGRDPGELLALADACARHAPRKLDALDPARLVDAREALDEALAALDAILACIPDGQEAVPVHGFTSAAGRAIHDDDPARFRRDYLSARRAHLNSLLHAIRRRLGALADPAFHARTAAMADSIVQAMHGSPQSIDVSAILPSHRSIRFFPTDDARHPYAADVDGARWTVRVNEFPEEPSVYSLLVDGVVAEGLMAWPAAWERPDH